MNWLKLATLCSIPFFASKSLAVDLKVGQVAPDFTLTDLNGVSHNLYKYLGQGKTVLLDISAAWCGPCWSYHKQGVLAAFHKTNGPEGTNKGLSLMVEGDERTTNSCLSGASDCVGGTIGNWVKGTKYPIINPNKAQTKVFASAYKVLAYPSVYLICPDKKIVLAGSAGPTQFQDAMRTKCSPSVSVLDGDIDAKVSIGPRLSSGVVQVYFKANPDERVEVEVFDAKGTLLFTRAATGSKDFGFDFSGKANGLYYFKLKMTGESVVRKMVLN